MTYSRNSLLIFLYILNSSGQLCEKSSLVSDCQCEFETVDVAVKSYFAPVLTNLTQLPFYRYFRVDLAKPCPFWKENGQCANEACSVCMCDVGEIPRAWVSTSDQSYGEYGWFSPSSSRFGNGGDGHDDILGRVDSTRQQDSGYEQFLFDNRGPSEDNHEWWIDMTESQDHSERGTFVNLVKNPERFTGYSGESARRVWQGMMSENCFGGDDDVCLEKRVFFKLMSGLQASISVHIAKQYYTQEEGWHANISMFHRAVGSHPLRLNNLYFAFLFMLRAVSRAGEAWLKKPLEGLSEADWGGEWNKEEYERALELIKALIAYPEDKLLRNVPPDNLRRCREAFNESVMFQVPESAGGGYWQQLHDKQRLREEFRNKFRNVSRIMDCVTCEKCKMWGKLQVLGLGTAIRLLLTPEGESISGSRQEVIALVNALTQFARSVEFASSVMAKSAATQKLNVPSG